MKVHQRHLIAAVFAAAVFAHAAPLKAAAFPPWAVELAKSACAGGRLARAPILDRLATLNRSVKEAAQLESGPGFERLEIALQDGEKLTLTFRLPGTAHQRLRLTTANAAKNANGSGGRDVLLQLNPDCSVNLGRVLDHAPDGAPVRLTSYDDGIGAATDEEDLNPPVPAGKDPGGVAVALFDSGINYTLPDVAERLARDDDGQILGFDFADNDKRPYDLDPTRPALFPIRHGTTVASVVAREAPGARLIPYRYPGRAMARFADMVTRAAASPARIVSMPLGGYDRAEWLAFAEAARAHPELLFIVSAGNGGRDIDADPVWPAAFDLANMVVVTSSDAFGKIAAGSNWGAAHVDIAVPGERVEVMDHRGARARASGSSYAVPRVAALAARLKARSPGLSAAEIKARIVALAAPLAGRSKPVKHGWIPNPAIE